MKLRKHIIEESEDIHKDEQVRKRARSKNTTGPEIRDNDHDKLDSNFLKEGSTRRGLRPSVGREASSVDWLGDPDAGNMTDELADDLGEAESKLTIDLAKTSSNRTIEAQYPYSSRQTESPTFISNKPTTAKGLFHTPSKLSGNANIIETPKLERNINRSARKKSTRTFIERTVLGNISDNGDDEEDIAHHIYDSDEDIPGFEEAEAAEEPDETVNAPETPSKRRVGRPKGSKNRLRSPTPPQDLPAHELYFVQNRGGRSKTSNNNLSSLSLLDHEEYFSLLRKYEDPHAEDVEYLEDIHSRSFNQWQFELEHGFSICLYGWGSKRSLLMKFADHLYRSLTNHAKNKIIIINGYVRNLTIRDVLNTIASAICEGGQKLGSQPGEMLENLSAILEGDNAQHVTVVVHSIDQTPLRRPSTQTIISRLSSHPQIRLVASADHPSFPLLWDSSLRSTFNFVFHDCTTFRPHTVEIDVVDEVHELLGRSGRRVGGKEGVSFVLKSLPDNAKKLFRILILEQLASMDVNLGTEFESCNDGEHNNEHHLGNPRTGPGVEYRVLYQKAVEEFICSNEMNFRTLLKEFHDHQMIQSRKDALGAEMLSVPFRKDELDNILEDIEP